MSDPAAASPETGSPAPRPRWKRRLLVGLGVLLLALGVAVALLPAVLSSGWVRGMVETRGTEAAGRNVSLGALSVGWGASGAKDLVVRYGPSPSDPVLLRVGEVQAPAGITAALSGKYEVRTVRILRPEVRLDLRELVKPAAPPKKPAPPPGRAPGAAGAEAPLPAFSLRVEIREGSLVQVGLDGKESRLGSFSADLDASRDGPAEAAFDLDLGPAGKARVKVSALPFREGRPVDPDALESGLEATLEALDVAVLREAAAALGSLRLDRLEGTVTASVKARIQGGGVDVSAASVALRGLRIEAPETGTGLRVDEPDLRFEGGFALAGDGTLDLRDSTLRAPGIEARASASMPAPGVLNGAVSLKADVKALSDRGRALGLSFVPAAVGDLVLDARAVGDAAGQRVSGQARIRDLQVSPGPGKPPVDEPSVTVEFDLLRKGESLRVDAGSVKAGFLRMEARGSIASTEDGELHVTGSGDLGRIASLAEAFGAPLVGTVRGTAEVDARIRRTAPGTPRARDAAAGTLVLRELVATPPGAGAQPVREDRVEVAFDAALEGKTLRIAAGSVKSGALQAEAKGTLSETEDSDLSVRGRADLGRLAALAASFGAPLPGSVEGAAELDARLLRSAAGGAGDRAHGTLVVRNLVVTPPGEGGRPIREERLDASFDAVPGKEAVTVRSFLLKGAGAEALAAGTFAVDGATGSLDRAEATLDLAKVEGMAEAFGVALPVRMAGTASWKGPVTWKDTFRSLDAPKGEILVRDLEVVLPAGEGTPARTFREAEARATVDGAVEAVEGGWRTVIRGATVAAGGVTATASGTVAADRRLDLRTSGSVGLAALTRHLAAMGFLERDPAPAGSLAFDLAVRGAPSSPALSVERVETAGSVLDVRASGTLDMEGPSDLVVDGKGDLAGLLDLAARAGFGEPVKDPAGRMTLRLRASAADGKSPLSVTTETAVADLRLPDPKGGKPWTQKSVTVSVDASLDRAAASVAGTASIRTDDGTATVEGSAVLAEGKRSVDGKADLDLDLGGLTRARPELMPLPGMVVGRVKGTAKVRGPLATPFDGKGLLGTALLSLDSVTNEAFEVRDASLDLVLQGGTLAARSIAGTVNGGGVKGTAALGLAGDAPVHFLQLAAEGVEVDRSMAWLLKQVVPIFAVAESGVVSGRLKLDLRLDGKGPDWTAVKPNLAGKGLLEVSGGGVTGSGILVEVLELLGGARGMEFATVATEFAVRDQRVWNERLTVNGKEHAMVLKGSTTFDGRLDYSVGAKYLKMGPKRAERIRPLLDEEGNLPFGLGGTLSKPKVKPPDMKKVLGNVAEDLLKKKLRDLLGGDE